VEFEADVRGGAEEELGAEETGTAVEDGGREEAASDAGADVNNAVDAAALLKSNDSKRRVALSTEGDDCDAEAAGDSAKATEAPAMQTCGTSVFAVKQGRVARGGEADHGEGDSECRRHTLALGAREYAARGRGLRVAQQRLLHGVLRRFHRLRLATFFPIVVPERRVGVQILSACDACAQQAAHLYWDSSTTSMVM
jgi:hypothetical protein